MTEVDTDKGIVVTTQVRRHEKIRFHYL